MLLASSAAARQGAKAIAISKKSAAFRFII
jgi:hypothetical protein